MFENGVKTATVRLLLSKSTYLYCRQQRKENVSKSAATATGFTAEDEERLIKRL